MHIPLVDETHAPIQMGMNVERFPRPTGTPEQGARRNLKAIGKGTVVAVTLSDGAKAALQTSRFYKDGSRKSFYQKLFAADAKGVGWVVSAWVVTGKDSQFVDSHPEVGAWLKAHVLSFCFDARKFDEAAVRAAYEPPDKSKQSEPFFFIQMTDTQLGMRSADEGGMAKDVELFEKAVAAANRLKPAFVVITGDLVNGSRDKAQIAQFKRIAAKLDKAIPLHLAPGNHDIPHTKEKVLQLNYYREVFGKDRYTFTHGGCTFVVFNSYLPMLADANQAEAARQYKWLEDTFAAAAKAKSAHTVVLQHHPIFLKSIDEKVGYFNFPQAERKKYLDLFIANGVRYVFTGHWHRNAVARYKGLEMVITSAVSKPLGGRDKAKPGFRIVKVYPDRIAHEFVALDAVPKKVDLAAEPAKENTP